MAITIKRGKSRMQRMAMATSNPLPCDAYPSPQEWAKEQRERMFDGGFTRQEIAATIDTVVERAELRAAEKEPFTRAMAARTEGLSADARALILTILRETGLFISLKPTRNLARLAQHVARLPAPSKARAAYQRAGEILREHSDINDVQALFNANAENTAVWGHTFGQYIWWRPTFRYGGSWYPESSMRTCMISGKPVPINAATRVLIDEGGNHGFALPALVEHAPSLRQDPITSSWIQITAVEWVTLTNGMVVWKKGAITRGEITHDAVTNTWARVNTSASMGRYHNAPREWLSQRRGRYQGCIGVELECGFKSSAHRTRFLQKHVDNYGRFNTQPFLIETDSSLGDVIAGCEIISEPLPLYTGYQAPDAPWRWLLDQLVHSGAQGWANRQFAGIHVNLDISDREPNELVRFVSLINNAASISRFISGRKYIYHSGERGVTPDEELVDLEKFAALDRNHAGGGYLNLTASDFTREGRVEMNDDDADGLRQRGKYSTVHLRRDLPVAEVRIFGSNIRYEGFMACVEYCVAGMEFVVGLSSDSIVLRPDIGSIFCDWLAENADKYPNLVARLGTRAKDKSILVAARPLLELVA